jgi:phosphoglycerate dehydrogenase-like enzyme
MLPADVRPVDPQVPLTETLEEVAFYVPRYMGPVEDLLLMELMPGLRVVQLLTAGFESALAHLPPGVTLCNAGGVHDASTAELGVGLILASLRGIDDFARAMPSGQWLHSRRSSLADSRILILGAGGVGTALRDRLLPFEAEVVMVGRSARSGVHSVDELPSLLPDADVVVLAVPLDERTRGLVDAHFLAHLAEGALLVNVSRGAVVDTDALVAAVRSGRIRAALDVTDPEPLPKGHALWKLPGVIITPHIAGRSDGDAARYFEIQKENLARFAKGEALRHVVDKRKGY